MTLSFCRRLKNEILTVIPQLKCCREVMAAAICRPLNGNSLFVIHRTLIKTAKKFITGIVPEFVIEKCESNKLFLRGEIRPLQKKLLLRFNMRAGRSAPKHCHKSFLRGLFLGYGYMQNPRQKYHLEIRLKNMAFYKLLRSASKQFRIPFRFCRSGRYIRAYLKDRKGIKSFLRTIELYERALEIGDLAATRDLLGMVNRRVNFETANINRIVDASERTTERIRKLIEHPEADVLLSSSLTELALMKLKYPLDSLESLGRRFSPALTKSAVNHRLRRIEAVFKKEFEPG